MPSQTAEVGVNRNNSTTVNTLNLQILQDPEYPLLVISLFN